MEKRSIIYSSCWKALLLLCFVFPFSGFAQLTTPKYSNEFMNLGVGARALGMGNAQVAATDNVMAGYWNPAGLTRITEKYQAGLMHASYFAGMANYDYLAFTLPTDSLGRLAISAIRFAVDDIPDTRFLYDADGRLNYDNIRFFSAADYGFIVSYARVIPKLDGLRLGANMKVIHRNVGEFAHAWGIGLDAGAQYENGAWQFGLMLRDITGTFNAWVHEASMVEEIYQSTGNTLPQNGIEVTVPRAILSGGRNFPINEQFKLLAMLDLSMTFDGQRNVLLGSNFTSIDPSFGLELGFQDMLYLRTGVNNFQKVQGLRNAEVMTMQPNFGLGLKLSKFHIDYAMTDIGDVSDTPYSHIFSLMLSF
ncbi:PorV/PorQ family protein [Fulvivirgaceae bacterium LMO-SS25]